MKPWWTKQATGGRLSGYNSQIPFRHYQQYNEERKMAKYTTALTPYRRAPVARTTSMEGRRLQAVARGRPRRVPGFPRKRKMYRKRLGYKVAKSAAGSTFSRLVFGSPRVPKQLYTLFKNNQSYSIEGLFSARLTSPFGQQSVTYRNINDAGQLGAMFATIPQLSASTLIQDTGKFFLQTTKSKLTFTNQDLATCYVKIYSLVPRFHLPTGNDPISLWDIGLENQTLVPAFNTQYLDAYATPFRSQTFCLFWKVDKVTEFELGQGQSHCHETTYHTNKEVHGQINNKFAYLRDLSKVNMIVASGTPINDLTNKTNVSTSSCAIDVVEHVIKEYTYAAAQRTIRQYTNTLGAITTAEIASIGAGIVVNEDEA